MSELSQLEVLQILLCHPVQANRGNGRGRFIPYKVLYHPGSGCNVSVGDTPTPESRRLPGFWIWKFGFGKGFRDGGHVRLPLRRRPPDGQEAVPLSGLVL